MAGLTSWLLTTCHLVSWGVVFVSNQISICIQLQMKDRLYMFSFKIFQHFLVNHVQNHLLWLSNTAFLLLSSTTWIPLINSLNTAFIYYLNTAFKYHIFTTVDTAWIPPFPTALVLPSSAAACSDLHDEYHLDPTFHTTWIQPFIPPGSSLSYHLDPAFHTAWANYHHTKCGVQASFRRLDFLVGGQPLYRKKTAFWKGGNNEAVSSQP